ncbi:MAG TPA: 2-oxo-4-hydroxy-4-carboxy-5-ureidoimidazoline decarboxylase [Blastocatellia bacterium]|nr:2-oxo-4-hydroxy-4-carboxy-5-ureidoimidazoline decarboxylase [Blastocatellia bacterium]
MNLITGLEQLNAATREDAFAALLSCCGSIRWAQRMTEARPFADSSALIGTAERIWRELRPADWLEAFASHPRIGERRAAVPQSAQSAQWSEAEQSGTRHSTPEILAELAEASRAYEEKFGYLFIVCATGKSSEQMLAICRERLGNDYEAELFIAAEEQRKITEIRLRKLIGALR